MYAVGHPSGRGLAYEVEPVGVLEDDPDCFDKGLSYSCERARVLRVLSISRAERELMLVALVTLP